MNILYICDEYPPGRNGGIGTMVQVLGRELVKQGHNVYVAGLYSYRYGGNNFEEDKGVKVWRLRYGLNLFFMGNNFFYNILEKLPNWLKKKMNGKIAYKKFLNFIEVLIEKEKIDVIEIPDWNSFSFVLGYLVTWPKFKVPLILKSHGSYTYFNLELNLPLNPIYHKIDIELFNRADALTAVSNYTAINNQIYFSLKRESKVLLNSIEISKHANTFQREEQTVIFVGSLLKKKGIFQLVKAWNLVYKKHPQAKLFIFGKGKINSFKKLLNKEANLSVEFKNHVSRFEILNQFSKATLAVFPSYSETFGLMCIEAMSMGCPVIYTKRSCGSEIITDNENGLLIDPDNIIEIEEAISKLLNDKLLRENFSANGFTTVKNKFNVVNSAKEHVDYYKLVSNEFKLKKI